MLAQLLLAQGLVERLVEVVLAQLPWVQATEVPQARAKAEARAEAEAKEGTKAEKAHLHQALGLSHPLQALLLLPLLLPPELPVGLAVPQAPVQTHLLFSLTPTTSKRGASLTAKPTPLRVNPHLPPTTPISSTSAVAKPSPMACKLRAGHATVLLWAKSPQRPT